MTDTRTRIDSLRKRAEGALARGASSPAALDRLDIFDIDVLLQELQTHDAELEIQNLELGRSQQANETQSRRYRMLFGALPLPVFVVDDGGRIREANSRALGTFGFSSRQSMVQYSLLRLIDSDGGGRLMAILASRVSKDIAPMADVSGGRSP